VGTWIKCTDERGQTIHANLDNVATLFRDDARHRGTVIAFMGGATDAIIVRETPEEILKAAWRGVEISLSGRPSRPARAAHAPGPTAFMRKPSAPQARQRGARSGTGPSILR
jgi:hypothetical protein